MTLYHFTIKTRSPWRTPWQADTLLGILCVTAARYHGADFLRNQLIDPMLEGRPPFVLSDAMPADWLPLPTILRLEDSPEAASRKLVKRARWLDRDDFLLARQGQVPAFDRWRQDPFQTDQRRHNTLGRHNNTTLEEGGLFSRDELHWKPGAEPDHSNLRLYARVHDPQALELLHDLLLELALTGYGADTATGRGQFEVVGEPVPDPALDQPPEAANALICLSTFQPAPGDPGTGYWETFPRFGKLGPDLAVSDVRKHTLILLRPGACFHSLVPRPFLGRALPMDLILPKATAAELHSRQIEVVHPAFGLVIPARLPQLLVA